jgi:hypothetical protein
MYRLLAPALFTSEAMFEKIILPGDPDFLAGLHALLSFPPSDKPIRGIITKSLAKQVGFGNAAGNSP